jgi:hypothetical protein
MATKTRSTDLRERAIELGVYLPLGAYSRVRDEIADLDLTNITGTRIRNLYGDLVDRGQSRVQPRVRKASRRIQQVRGEATKTARKTGRRAEAAADAIAPKLPRVAAPKKASELPIQGYASLTASEIVAETRGLTQTELARVYKFEKAHENRSTILESIESRFVDLPIATYDDLTVDEISDRITSLSQDQLKTLRRYENDTKARVTVIERIDSELSA